MRPLIHGSPDEIDLELLRLGALSKEQAARVGAAAEAELADADAELAAFQDYWQAHRPQLVVPQPVPKTVSPPRPWGRWLLAAAAMLAIAAGGVALLQPESPDIRAMGQLPVDLQVLDAAGGTPGRFEQGDALLVSVTAPAEGTVAVFTLQEDGAVSMLHTGSVRARERYTLPGGARLDGYAGREWIVVEFDGKGEPTGASAKRARALLPDPSDHAGARRWVTEITRWTP